MRTSADYRELAGHCVRLAQAASTPEHRSMLLNIAHAWLRLAEGAELDRNWRSRNLRAAVKMIDA
jgi:hypothetical protein